MSQPEQSYVNTIIKRLRTFFRANGYEDTGRLKIRTYFVPSRYRKVPEYIPTKSEIYAMADAAGGLRERAIILALWSSGLRVSTFCALNYGDVAEELNNRKTCIKVPTYPEMKERVPEACKGQVAYYTFICREATETLRSYIKEREQKYGPLSSDAPLFVSEWTLWPRGIRQVRRLGRGTVERIVKEAARLAGLPRWKYITPHCLRKAFESVLRSQTIEGGRMDKGTQEFLMGHILPGTQDPYYDRANVDFHCREYAKLDFAREGPRAEAMDKVVRLEELEERLKQGWLFVAKVGEDKVVVRKSV